MKYRIRMRYLRWYIYLYNADGSEAGESGPFALLADAVAHAESTGFKDWDKGE